MAEPASKRGRARDAEKTRQAILDAAEAVFAELGFGRARVDAIAQAADYNKSLIGQYFGDKLGLYVEVLKRIDREITALRARFAPMLEDETIASDEGRLKVFLETMVGALFDYLLDHPRFLRILSWEMAEGWQTYAQLVPQLHLEESDQFETLFRPAQRAGLLRADLSLLIQMTLVLQICHSYLAFLPLYQLLLPGEDVSSARALARGRAYLVALMVQGMLVAAKDDETRERKTMNRPEARNDHTE
jgi:TetR/AcrR family transcriptional regulator